MPGPGEDYRSYQWLNHGDGTVGIRLSAASVRRVAGSSLAMGGGASNTKKPILRSVFAKF